MGKNKERYVIACGAYQEDLVEAVERILNEEDSNWTTAGGPLRTEAGWYQALVKEKR